MSTLAALEAKAEAEAYEAELAAIGSVGTGSTGTEELREQTDQERQQRMEESDAARAAALLRGSSFKVPLQPDLEAAIAEEEQERRRQAVRAVETSRAPITADAPESTDAGVATNGGAAAPVEVEVLTPPAGTSPPSSLMGKIVMGMGMGGFFAGLPPSEQRSRAESGGSGVEQLRELTDQERQQRMEGSRNSVQASEVRRGGRPLDLLLVLLDVR